jgi:ATP-dependent DNA helicase PIF1
MMHYRFFECLEYAARKIRGNPYPFGGIQLICSGDFNQLPPVISNDQALKYNEYKIVAFCPSWKRTMNEVIMLTEIIRQKDDPVYCKMLEEISKGEVTQDTVDKLNSRVGAVLIPKNGVVPVALLPRNNDVNMINDSRLSSLDESDMTRTFKWSITSSGCNPAEAEILREKTIKSVVISEELRLKKDAKVMLIVNLSVPLGLVNGSQGVVKYFDPKDGLPMVQFSNQKEITKVHYYEWNQYVYKGAEKDFGSVTLKAIPLVLGWAMTIHKSQGMTIEQAEIDIGPTIFSPSQAYVALSRARHLNDISLFAFDIRSIRVEPEIVEYYRQMEAADKFIIEDDEEDDHLGAIISTSSAVAMMRPEAAKKYVDPSRLQAKPQEVKSDLMRKLRMAHNKSRFAPY